ncbi:pilus assembly protein [Propioniciclava coleopterorum]|uniref:Pilus assembly protein n=1 Tax=Propioniciclava coleopterorum TaxID=2714937 RepID=A0A6G7Y6P0_9ACTN|nr:TadE/TadG family type IV pilus assembly protein [Propioniciclava coleopterorum]QIK72291.1 pilus assembly protein [Propioniciclava coleopterorum]
MTRRDERGVTDSVQWAILLPAVLLSVLGIIQVGLWAHGRTVATNAAVAAAERAALYRASTADARATAARVAQHGGLVDLEVSLVESADQITVRVAGRMPTFFDLGQTRVEEQASRPRERVTRP